MKAEYHRVLEEYQSSDSEAGDVDVEVDVDEPGPSGLNSFPATKPKTNAALPSSSGLRNPSVRLEVMGPGPSGVGTAAARPGPSGIGTNSRGIRSKAGPSRRAHDNILVTWSRKCEELVQLLCQSEDSTPFRFVTRVALGIHLMLNRVASCMEVCRHKVRIAAGGSGKIVRKEKKLSQKPLYSRK